MAKEDLDLDVEAAAPVKKSGAMKWIIIGVLGLVVLVGATVGVLYFAGILGGGDDTETAAEAEVAADAEHGDKPEKAGKNGKAAKGDKAAAKAPLIYLPMEPPFVVNFTANANVRFMQVSLQVAAREQAVIDQVKEHTPAIRNGLVMLFTGQDPVTLNTREGKEALLKQCLDEVNKVLKEQTGSAGVENVYFTSFVMQ
ncbi:MAG TPA: flagellar basal body-associated FliL family protein [Gammaproteobacteria bacterium]